MNKATLKALKESIAHWRRMATGKMEPDERIGSDHCALCDMFLDEFCCSGCPVAEKTGAAVCSHTPYHDAYDALDNYGFDSKEFKAAAKKELKFLESLLPKKRKVKP